MWLRKDRKEEDLKTLLSHFILTPKQNLLSRTCCNVHSAELFLITACMVWSFVRHT